MESTPIFLIFIYVFIGLSFVGAITLLFVFAKKGSWRDLKKHYATDDYPLSGDRIHLGHIRIGWVDYQNMVSAYRQHNGLYLSMYLRWPSAPRGVLIPWNEIHSPEVRSMIIINHVRFQVGHGEPNVTITITEKKYRALGKQMPDLPVH